MKLAIIGDEQIRPAVLKQGIRAWSEDKNIHTDVIVFEGMEHFLLEWVKEQNYAMLFWNIPAQKASVGDMVRLLRERNEDLAAVRITGGGENGRSAEEAVHVLPAGAGRDDIARCMDRALLESVRERYLLARTKEGLLKIAADRIMYIEAVGSGSRIEFCPYGTSTFQVESTDDIAVLEQRLGAGFVRCHKAYLCRLDKIRRITRSWIEMRNGSRISINRALYAQVCQSAVQYFKEQKAKRQPAGL